MLNSSKAYELIFYLFEQILKLKNLGPIFSKLFFILDLIVHFPG